MPTSASTTTPTTRYGLATASAWHRMHPRLARRGAWLDHPEDEDAQVKLRQLREKLVNITMRVNRGPSGKFVAAV